MDVNVSLVDQLLIAMPNLAGSEFSGAVTYLCQHAEEGALGIVINTPSTVTLGEVMKQMGIEDIDTELFNTPVYLGGPVEPERGFIIHEPLGEWESSLQVSDTIALTTSRDILQAIAKKEGPEQFLIALGYAGWGAQQLEQEIIDNAWLTVPASQDIMFRTPANERLKHAADSLGFDFSQIAHEAGHA